MAANNFIDVISTQLTIIIFLDYQYNDYIHFELFIASIKNIMPAFT
jgi:hypothetical protein